MHCYSFREVRWIAFDAVGTLIFPSPSVATVYAECGARFGSKLRIDEVRKRFSAAFQTVEQAEISTTADESTVDQGNPSLERAGGIGSTADSTNAYQRVRPARPDTAAHSGQITSEAGERERWRRIVRSVLFDVDNQDACFQELFAHFARPTSWNCYSDVGRTLTALRQSGFHLAVASNFDSRLRTVIQGHPELSPLELTVISSEIGHRKPSERFYRELASQTHCASQEILMVGDDFENDVRGAVRYGLQAAFLSRPGDDMPEALGLQAGPISVERYSSLDELTDALIGRDSLDGGPIDNAK